MNTPRIDRRVKGFFRYCGEVAERTEKYGRGFLYQVNSHARCLDGGLREQVRVVAINSLTGGEGYDRTIFLMNFCPLAFGKSCAYGQKRDSDIRND